MRIKSVIDFVRKLMPILEFYKDRTVNEMLDDIYRNCCKAGLTDTMSSETEPPAQPKRKAKAEWLSAEEAIARIRGMDEDECQVFLNSSCRLVELREIARQLQIKIKSKANKKEIVATIASQRNKLVDNAQGVLREAGGKKNRLGDAATQVAGMKQDEIIDFLGGFNKSEILEISRRLNLQISASNTKANIILLIAKHFGYKEVSRRMFERPRRL